MLSNEDSYGSQFRLFTSRLNGRLNGSYLGERKLYAPRISKSQKTVLDCEAGDIDSDWNKTKSAEL